MKGTKHYKEEEGEERGKGIRLSQHFTSARKRREFITGESQTERSMISY